MKYFSTRHQSTEKASLSFGDVLFSPGMFTLQLIIESRLLKNMCSSKAIISNKGYSKDGGLYVPEEIPRISKEELIEWKSLSYRGIVEKVLRLYTSPSELTDEEIKGMGSCNTSVFLGSFRILWDS